MLVVRSALLELAIFSTLNSTFCGLSWCSIAFMTHFCRPMREKSSFCTRLREYQSAWSPVSFCSPASIQPRIGEPMPPIAVRCWTLMRTPPTASTSLEKPCMLTIA